MQDFKNMQEVYGHVEETAIIDLLKPALALDEKYVAALLPPEAGLYLPGGFEPTFRADRRYYARSKMIFAGDPSVLDDPTSHKGALHGSVVDARSQFIENLLELPRMIDDIYDASYTLVISKDQMRRIGRHLSPDPTIPANAVRMAIGTIQSAVSTMCRHSCGGHNQYRPDRLIKPECREMIDNDDFLHAFEALLDEVQTFIGKDHWNYYTYRIKGTTLLIHKGIDFRIGDWYRMKFDKDDAQHQDD